MQDVMISVRDLAMAHGATPILNGVDLDVRGGEVAVLIGSSGSGKSTLLRCLNGLQPFQAGSVRVDKCILSPHTSPKWQQDTYLSLRRTVGMVFQQFNLFSHLNVLDNVTMAPRIALGWERAKADGQAQQLLKRVGLGHRLTAMPDQLSGGEQQRVAIARAMAMQPQAILFDEPTSALDPRMSGEVLAVIADLARDGLTMIIVTHAMTFARQVAHTVHVMHGGKIVESGTPNQVLAAPINDATKSLLRDSLIV